MSSNLIAKPKFLCKSNPRDSVESFIDAVEGLATQSKTQMKLKFLEVETAIKSKLTRTLESLSERRCPNQRVLSSGIIASKMITKRRMLQHSFCNCRKINWLSSKNILNVTATYNQCLDLIAQNTTSTWSNPILLTILINERNMEPTVIEKANQFVSINFGDVQLPDNIKFLSGATSLDSLLKAYKTSETKGFFPYEWFDCPQKMNNSELPPYDAFFSKLRNMNPLEKDYSDYQTLLSSGLKTEEALSKMKLSKPPPSREENYQYLPDIWNHVNMCTFKDFLRWYNNKDVVPTLEAMQKNVCFLSQEWNWHIEARVYTSDFCENLSPKIYQRQVLSIYWYR